MADVLIREVPNRVIAAIEADAKKQGLSRSEYLRRLLEHSTGASAGSVTVGDLDSFSEAFADLADPEVMDDAWK